MNPERKNELEKKILYAKELGIKFKLQDGNRGFIDKHSIELWDTINVLNNFNDGTFEAELDKKIAEVEYKTFMTLLTKHKLI